MFLQLTYIDLDQIKYTQAPNSEKPIALQNSTAQQELQ